MTALTVKRMNEELLDLQQQVVTLGVQLEDPRVTSVDRMTSVLEIRTIARKMKSYGTSKLVQNEVETVQASADVAIAKTNATEAVEKASARTDGEVNVTTN